MWSFLNIAFHWAEMYMTLKYYCSDSTLYQGILDNNTKTSCNISYTHPYLTDREWCLLSERITNFGEMPCKNFLVSCFNYSYINISSRMTYWNNVSSKQLVRSIEDK